ncbi:MAG: hypothetical protein JOZ58_17000 [Acetobacteraceae bacterium]|nr:hypothetical protein [Acetobacteraceae bacterium]
MLLSMVARSFVGFILPGLLLFIPAGTLAWPQAWVFLVIFIGCSLATGLWLKKADPELLAERMKSPLSADQRPRDRAVIIAILAWFAAWLVLMGLDNRFGWSSSPVWAQAAGGALIVAAFWGWITVLRANSFASVTVRVQTERVRPWPRPALTRSCAIQCMPLRSY